MKTPFLLLAILVAAPLAARAQLIDINFTVGILSDADGNPVPDGSLIQVIADTGSDPFSTPTPTDFLGGNPDELLLFSGAFDSSTVGVPGAMFLDIPDLLINSGADTASSGDPLLIQWFPTLSAASSPSVPGTVDFGQYGYAQDSTWTVPDTSQGGGQTTSYTFLTVNAGGDLDDATYGYANSSTAGISAAPEPSFYGMVAAIGLAAFTLARSRSRSRSASPSPAIG